MPCICRDRRPSGRPNHGKGPSALVGGRRVAQPETVEPHDRLLDRVGARSRDRCPAQPGLDL